MAKKKQIETEVVEQQPTTSAVSQSTIGYKGEVTISKRRGKKVITTKKYHNSGYNNLFKFFAYCLAGNYTSANDLKPMRIKAYWNTITNPAQAVPTQNLQTRSHFVTYDSTPVVNEVKNNTCSVSFHFTIPASYITGSVKEGGVEVYKINQLCLFTENDDNEGSILAYFYLLNSAGTDWDPEILNVSNQEYNYYIDWKMTIQNNTVSINKD